MEGDSVGKYLDASWSWCAECEIIQRDFLFGCMVLLRRMEIFRGIFLGACIASQNVELFRGFVVNIWMDRVVELRMELCSGIFAIAIASLTSESCFRYRN